MAIGIWFGVLAGAAICGALSGVSMSPSTTALLLVGGFVPPAVLLMVWRGAPPLTVAQVLHAAERRV